MPRNSRASAVKKPRTAPWSVCTTRGAKPVRECPAATALPVAMPVSPTARPAVAASQRMDRLDAMACPIFGHQDSGPPPDAGLTDRCPAIGCLGGSHNGYSLVVFTALVGRSRQEAPRWPRTFRTVDVALLIDPRHRGPGHACRIHTHPITLSKHEGDTRRKEAGRRARAGSRTNNGK